MKELIQICRAKMERSLTHFKDAIFNLRGGDTITLIESLRVKFKGSSEAIGKLAYVMPAPHNAVSIRPHDREAGKDIRKALDAQGISTYGGDDCVYANLPRMDSGQIEKVVAQVRKLAEESRVAMRNIRHEGKKQHQKDKRRLKSLLTEDEERRLDQELLKLVDEFTRQIDAISEKKIKCVLPS